MEDIHKITRIRWTESDDDKVREFIAANGTEKDITDLIELIPYRTQSSIIQRVLKFKSEKKLFKKKPVITAVKITAEKKLENLYLELGSTGILDPNYSELLNQINNLEITVNNQKRWQ